jgi:hypothetical protein
MIFAGSRTRLSRISTQQRAFVGFLAVIVGGFIAWGLGGALFGFGLAALIVVGVEEIQTSIISSRGTSSQ